MFLPPQSHEEYALARTERNKGKGYTRLQYYSGPDVTLSEDLLRRDLTINTIAKQKMAICSTVMARTGYKKTSPAPYLLGL